MLDNLLNTNTLLCLGITFILTSVLFLYFRRSISILEKAQMEQARLLQSFITNMEMCSVMKQVPVNNVSTSNVEKRVSDLIEVSDNDSDNSDDSDDSDDDESDDEITHTHREIIDLTESLEEDVKVIKLIDDNSNNTYIEELNNNIDNIDYDDDDDDDDEDEDDDDDDNNDNNDTHKDVMVTQETLMSNVNEVLNVNKKELIDYNTLTLFALRDIAETKGIIGKGEKKNKKELIKLLHQTM